MDPMAIAAKMSTETFSEMMAVSPRRVREILFSQFGVKKKNTSLLKNLHQKKEERMVKLHECFKKSTSTREAEVCKELIRNWLITKRPMLKSTLDFLGVSNDNGLTETEPTVFKELSKEKTKALVEHLEKQFPKEHVLIYLSFMETPNLD